jgi:hypothetical protein
MAEDISTQIVREAPEIEAYKLGLLQKAQGLYGTPLNLPAVEAAQLSATQGQAARLAGQGIGQWKPYMAAGTAGVTQGQQLASQGAGILGAMNVAPQFQQAQTEAQQYEQANLAPSQGILGQSMAGYNPATAQQFMNPYQTQVTEKALGEMRRQGDIAAQGTAAQAVRAGAFGGTREGVQRAEQERNLQDLMSQRTFQDYAANYNQAQAAGMTTFEQERQRQLAAGTTIGQQQLAQAQLGQAGAGLIGSLAAQEAGIGTQRASTLGQLGSSMGTMGMQQATLGQAGQQLNTADVSLLSGIGALEQQNAQAQLDASRATRLQEAMTPYQQLAFVSDIYKGAPSSQMTLTSASAPSASPLQSALGTVVGGVTTAAAASKAGLF